MVGCRPAGLSLRRPGGLMTSFGIPSLTFIVDFAVMASGITSAATLSRAFAGDYLKAFVDVPVVAAADSGA